MSSLLIKDLSRKDNSCFLSKNEIKYIYGGECYYLGTVRSKDGKEYSIWACQIP
jgi:hypothetical protein